MELAIVLVFIIGYIFITIEHNIKIDKLVPALLMMAISWSLISFGLDGFSQWFDVENLSIMNNFVGIEHHNKMHIMETTLLHHFGKTAEILIFLIGAMTIVEIIDFFNGFSVIKNWIKTQNKLKLLYIITFLAFFLSSIIDNLTTTIVLITLLRKILTKKEDRLWFSGMIIIAANSGGAWSPIGDVTTTMLWIGNKVTTVNLISKLIIPSIVSVLVPLIICSFLPIFKGNFEMIKNDNENNNKYSGFMLIFGMFMIIFVPIFKTITHLPPYLGMMFSLGIVSVIAEVLSKKKFDMFQIDTNESNHKISPTFKALSKVEIPSILFFLGILMTVAAMESLGLIFDFGNMIQSNMNINLFIVLMGLISAVIDNVPLVAASMGMFDMTQYPIDSNLWHFIAYSAGTGGSILIIGSAAGVVAMGMEKIEFIWYLKRISLLALIGFLAGCGVILLY